ncbi:hypothetical protein J437_LFUL010292 [Ladona fulva]|uniref:Flavoprotein domain-containing protein n=1 Tax=Ladona fulva TaxID=123851 RepID=A0A8K0KCE6_LADFU|nr:hypothetical protein J437_LFUL010292 [Ladona fulva]
MVGKNILIGVTGSVATIKLPLLAQGFISEGSDVRLKIVTTERARHFYDTDSIAREVLKGQSLSSESCSGIKENSSREIEVDLAKDVSKKDEGKVEILGDEDEWAAWSRIGDPVLHIELCKWADVFVIAPLDANTMGKLTNGICDNLLTCVFRAWDVKKKPLVFCPAMNTKMWTHPITEEQVNRLVSWGLIYVPPISKKLACGDEGTGAMAEYGTIIEVVMDALKRNIEVQEKSSGS